jgi:hypothetical protein
MKKEDAVNSVESVGNTIHEVNSKMWMTALNPTDNGWPASLLSAAAIPITNTASLGALVARLIVREVPESVYDKIPGSKK